MSALLAAMPDSWLNFLLHTALLSVPAWLACRLIRHPGRRAFIAATAVLMILALPWISAARPWNHPLHPTAKVGAAAPPWPAWTLRLESPRSVPAAAKSSPSTSAVTAPPPVDFLKAAAALWLAGTAAGLGGIALRQWRLRRWSRQLRHPSAAQTALIRSITGAPARWQVCDQIVSPCVIGLRRPQIVLPRFLIDEGNPAALAWALRHETEHLRAGDSRLAVALAVAKAFTWWNPAVHSLAATWAEAREQVCDARATEGTRHPAAYGTFLLDLSQRCSGSPGASAAVLMANSGKGRRLKLRLQAILAARQLPRLTRKFKAAVCLGALAAGLIASCGGVKKTPSPATPDPTTRRAARPEQAPQIKIVARFFESATPLAPADRILTAGGEALFNRQAASIAGTNLIAMPSITVRDRQNGRIEIIRTTHNDPAAADDDRFLGIVLDATPTLAGNKAELAVDLRLRYQPGANTIGNLGSLGGLPADFDWSKVATATARSTVRLEAGHSAILRLKGYETGRHLIAIISAIPVDKTGQPTSGFDLPHPRD